MTTPSSSPLSELRYAGNTAYHHTLWDRYEFLNVLGSSQELLHQDLKNRQELYYSFVQDAFYALCGNEIRSRDELGFTVEQISERRYLIDDLWKDLSRHPEFEVMTNLFNRNQIGQITATYYTAQAAERLTQARKESAERKERAELDPWQEQLDELDPSENEDEPDNDEDKEDNPEGEEDNGETEQTPGEEESSQGDSQEQDEQEPGPQPVRAQPPTQPQPGPVQQPVRSVPVGPVGREYKPAPKPRPQPGQKPQPSQPSLEAEEAEAKAEMMAGLMPYVGPGSFNQKYDNVNRLLKENKFPVKEFARYLGFVRNAVRGVHREAEATSGVLTGYQRSEWSEKLHPVDMLGIATGNLHTLSKLAEGNLRKRRYETKRPRGRGPVIIVRDESGSMTPSYGVREGLSKNDQAKLLEMSMAVCFNEEKRELISIAWNQKDTRTCVYGKDDVRAHLSSFLDGGTALKHALTRALEVADEYVEGADIMILTDGAIGDDDEAWFNETLKEFREKNGRVWLVLVGGDSPHMKWVDGAIKIEDIGNSRKLNELIASMNRKDIAHGQKVRL